jgi:hypothetical protein
LNLTAAKSFLSQMRHQEMTHKLKRAHIAKLVIIDYSISRSIWKLSALWVELATIARKFLSLKTNFKPT